ncbi:hypothetical protein ACFWNH_29345 [Rhodococcus qingshengii]|uniref:hypothetical protein n=1 Tax=Rhodococcus qingshengii TaxID=334542 RepID=UPI00364E2A10
MAAPTGRRGVDQDVVVFPLLEAFGEEVRIVDDFTFKQSAELVESILCERSTLPFRRRVQDGS